MLFNEVYGSYYATVAAILKQALVSPLTSREITDIVMDKAFGESITTIPEALKSRQWPLLDDSGRSILQHEPTMPLTMLQKQWLKAILLDPRVALFEPDATGLEDVEPLYTPDMVVYFDRYADGDPYEDPSYRAHFRVILTALREKRKLRIRFKGHRGNRLSWVCIPHRLEYSEKDDKFRVITTYQRKTWTVNLARINSVELLEPVPPDEYQAPRLRKRTLVLELTDERNALERIMLHFSHLEKETERLDEKHYRMTLHYDQEDETEMVIRVLSFGPMLKVVSPDSFIALIRERLERQSITKET